MFSSTRDEEGGERTGLQQTSDQHSSSPVKMSSPFANRYKNAGLTQVELRRRREQETVELRKQKREEQWNKRRNIGTATGTENGTAATLGGGAGGENAEVFTVITKDVIDILFAPDPDTAALFSAVQTVRKVLSHYQPPIDAILSIPCITLRLTEILSESGDTPNLQFETAWALTNIASGTSEQTAEIVKAGALPVFVELLTSPSLDVKEQAVWALGNVSGDNPQYRDYCLDLGAMPLLVDILTTSAANTNGAATNDHNSGDNSESSNGVVHSNNEMQTSGDGDNGSAVKRRHSLIRNTVWTVTNLCRGRNPPPSFEKVSLALPALARQLFSSDVDILSDACWAVAYLSDGTNDHIEAVVKSGVVRRLVELLVHPKSEVASASIRAIGNIVTGDDAPTDAVIRCSVLGCLEKLLLHPKASMRKEACWTVSNITAGNRQQIQAVIDSGIFGPLVEACAKEDFRTRKEACWAISNALSAGSDDQVRRIVEFGAVPAICELLTIAGDAALVVVALNGLQSVLRTGETTGKAGPAANPYARLVEECYGLDRLELLLNSDNAEVFVKAVDIYNRYFNCDGASPARDGGTDNTREFAVNNSRANGDVAGEGRAKNGGFENVQNGVNAAMEDMLRQQCHGTEFDIQ